jgi:hypothetical protein
MKLILQLFAIAGGLLYGIALLTLALNKAKQWKKTKKK